MIEEIQRMAELAVDSVRERKSHPFDYSLESLEAVDSMVEEASNIYHEIPQDTATKMIQSFGCYVLEVGRRHYGGNYYWNQEEQQPVLVVGEPKSHIAIMTWSRVRECLTGDTSENISALFEEFASAARALEPGRRVAFI